MAIDLTPQVEVQESLRKTQKQTSQSQSVSTLAAPRATYPRTKLRNRFWTSAAPKVAIEPPYIGSLLCSKA
jgi:hypothetical protein